MSSVRFVLVLSLVAAFVAVAKSSSSGATTAASKATASVPRATSPAPQDTTAEPAAPTATTLIAKATKSLERPTISQLSGGIVLEVSDVGNFAETQELREILQESLATCVGLPTIAVKILDIKVAQADVHQASGIVTVDYEILDKSNAILPANVAISGSAMQWEGNRALQKAQVATSISKATFSTPTKVSRSFAAPTPAPTSASLAATSPQQGNPCEVPATKVADASRVSQMVGNLDIAELIKTGADDYKQVVANITKMVKSTEEKVQDLKPWEKKASIAAVSVAGAAAVAGGIAGIVEAQAAPKHSPKMNQEASRPPVLSAKMTQVEDASQPRVVTVKVPVEIPVQPKVVPMLYDAQAPKQGIFMTKGFFFVAGSFLGGVSLFGCHIFGQRSRASQIHAFEQLPAEEAV